MTVATPQGTDAAGEFLEEHHLSSCEHDWVHVYTDEDKHNYLYVYFMCKLCFARTKHSVPK